MPLHALTSQTEVSRLFALQQHSVAYSRYLLSFI